GDLLDLGAASNIIEKSGAWYSYDNERIGQGRENARTFLIEHADTAAKIEAQLRKELGLPISETAPAGRPSGTNGNDPAKESNGGSARPKPGRARDVKVTEGANRN
ncbi:MAG TPA: recombinase RecA, partial [Vicinamibacteria bacterium]|nr:recombinase RecA [Vicinamibacteria bacterium]